MKMSYLETVKLSDLRGGQDGRKGHNHGKAEGIKAVACNTEGIGRRANGGSGIRDAFIKLATDKADSKEDTGRRQQWDSSQIKGKGVQEEVA